MNAKHTPGPWIFSESLSIFQAEGECELVASVACRSFIEPSNTEVSTARLISAAPDLLDGLNQAVWLIDGDLTGPEWKQACAEFLSAARSVIAKATGGQS